MQVRPTCPNCGRYMSMREDKHGMYLMCYTGLQYLDQLGKVVGGCLWVGDFRDFQIEMAAKLQQEFL